MYIKKLRSLSDHVKLDLSLDVGMKLNGNGVLTQRADHALRQTHFTLVDFNTGSTHGLGDVAGTHGAEQLAFITCQSRDGERADLFKLGSTILSFFKLSGDLSLKLGTLCLELLEVGRGCKYGLLVG